MAKGTEIINSLTWGKTKKSLPRLLKQYQLPQIVRVVCGVQCKSSEACVHEGQVLVLHEIDSIRKLTGTDNLGRNITIPLSCPNQGLVKPFKWKRVSCRVDDFGAIFPKVQYVRVKSLGSQTSKDDEASLKVGDFLQIKKVERKKKTVLCQNTNTDEYVVLSHTSPLIFTPLLDYRKYNLSEIVSNFGLPATVCFETTPSQVDENSEQTNGSLNNLNEFVFHKEISETQLLATAVAEVGEATRCLGLPTDLPIQCVVAKRTPGNEASYNNILGSLQAEFNEKNTTKKVSLFQDIHGVKMYDFTSLERPERCNEEKIPPPVSPETTESNIVKKTPPPVTPRQRKRLTEPCNVATTPTTVSPSTKKRFTYTDPFQSPIVANRTIQSSSDDSTTEANGNDDLSSTDEDDYLPMGNVFNVSEGERDKLLGTCHRSSTGESSTKHAIFARPEMNSNYTYCNEHVRRRCSLNLNQESEYCYAAVNPHRNWNFKRNSEDCGSKIPEEQVNAESSSFYEEIKSRWRLSCNNKCAIFNPNLKGRLASLVCRKFKVGKQNPYENVSWGKLQYVNVFTDEECGSNSEKFEIQKEADTIQGDCLDNDEYVEVNSPYENFEKSQNHTPSENSSGQQIEPSAVIAKTQSTVEDHQHTVTRQVEENRPLNALTEDVCRIFVDKSKRDFLTLSDVPLDLTPLSVQDVGRVLRRLNMHQHVETFANESVDGRLLATLEVEHLKGLNVGAFHAKKLLSFIHGWRPFHEDETRTSSFCRESSSEA